jgi:hypothetical protein
VYPRIFYPLFALIENWLSVGNILIKYKNEIKEKKQKKRQRTILWVVKSKHQFDQECESRGLHVFKERIIAARSKSWVT